MPMPNQQYRATFRIIETDEIIVVVLHAKTIRHAFEQLLINIRWMEFGIRDVQEITITQE